MNTTIKNICQSCGMPLMHITDFGTYRDGSINTEYCYHCYQDGAFTDEDISLEGKIARNIALARKLGISQAKALEKANAVLPKLKRWRKHTTSDSKEKIQE